MNSPKVSIIIPTYNRYALLVEAIESVRAQIFSDYELIIVDDGSDDNTPSLRDEPDIRYLYTPHCGMPGAVRNRGAEISRGEYLAFLDSDDLWLPEKLFLQVPLLDVHPEVPLVHTREIWRRGSKTVSQKGQKHKRKGDVFADALWKCTIGPSTVLMRTSVYREFGGFDESLEVAEDYEFWLRLTARYPVDYLDEPLVIKRAGEWLQLSEKHGQIEEFRIEALFRLLEQERLPQEHRSGTLAMLNKKLDIWSAGARKRGRDKEARGFYDRLERFGSC